MALSSVTAHQTTQGGVTSSRMTTQNIPWTPLLAAAVLWIPANGVIGPLLSTLGNLSLSSLTCPVPLLHEKFPCKMEVF